jgi:hypothetical protein
MSIFKITPTDFQSITVATNPFRYYSSSSSGITGSLRVFARKTFVEKDIESENDLKDFFKEDSLFVKWLQAKKQSKLVKNTSKNILGFVDAYLDGVNNEQLSTKKQKTLNVVRFTPTDYFSTGTLAKLAVKDNLSSYYRASYPSAHWGYCNYHSLNFFSSSTVPTSSVLLYPNVNDRYLLTGAFSLDFHINPRYKTLDSEGHFKAGTIFHLSSSYVLSLITGSLKDENGLPNGFRLQLQLDRSSVFPPSSVTKGTSPKDLVFLSEDNSLKWNNWHHVVVRWGTNKINHGTGSFVVDGIEKGTFDLNSSSFSIPSSKQILCIGNYYEGNNAGNNITSRFFATTASYDEGLYRLDTTLGVTYPNQFLFKHPLQAEVHDLSIKKFYMTDADIKASGSIGITDFKDVAFYLPPFFSFDSHRRGDRNGSKSKTAGVVYTPAIAVNGITTTPFNVPMAFGVDGHYINTENFLKDFSSGLHPRQLFLSASLVSIDANSTKKANDILYSQPSVRKRNLTILPCDDGNFYPNYNILQSNIDSKNDITYVKYFSYASNIIESLKINPNKVCYVDDLGNPLEGFINLGNMVFTGSRFNDTYTTVQKEDSYLADNIGFTPKNPLNSDKKIAKKKLEDSNDYQVDITKLFNIQHKEIPFSIPFKTQDASSNQVVFFDISNLFYGTRILPGSFTITDPNLSGSGGAISITIKDNGQGTLYRADSLTPNCTWNSVGTIFYNEGIVVIKSPHLYFFGERQYEMSFKGEQNLHVLRLETLAPINHLNSSSNPSYRQIPSSNRPNEPDPNFVYITGINFHDDNLNVVMKTQLAQPIMKRHSEKIMFKVKYDF